MEKTMTSKLILKHLRYASYLARHKWFVLLECVRLGVPLRGLTHDLSKLLPDEWLPYADMFYGGGKDKHLGQDEFDAAWLRHIHRNNHHPQHYVLLEDSGSLKVLDMPESAIREMVADWRGSGQAQGYGNDIRPWFDKNHHKHKMTLSTKLRVYELLERYDLILKKLLAWSGWMPPGVLGIGASKKGLLFVVDDLGESEMACYKLMDNLRASNNFRVGLPVVVVEEDQPHVKPTDFVEIQS